MLPCVGPVWPDLLRLFLDGHSGDVGSGFLKVAGLCRGRGVAAVP